MLNQIECPLSPVVTLDELPTNRTIKTVRDPNGVVWLSLNSVAMAAHTYPSRLTANLRVSKDRPVVVSRQATNPTNRTKLEQLTPLGHFLTVATSTTIGGTLHDGIRDTILIAVRDGTAALYDMVPLPAPADPDPLPEPVVNRMVQYETQAEQSENVNHMECKRLNAAVENGAVRLAVIPFFDKTIMACDADGSHWVQISHVCEQLGMQFGSQWSKIKAKPWMKLREMKVWTKDGKRRDVQMIDGESLPLWLATIDERKCSPAVRPVLLKFQLEAKDALANYFRGKSVIGGTATGDWSDIKGIVVQLTGLVSTVAQMQAATAERLDRMERALAAA